MPPSKKKRGESFLFRQNSNTYQNLLNNGIDWKRDNARAAQFVGADSEFGIFVVTGRTGTGKSTLTPKAILEAFSEKQLRGVVHLLPKKIAADSIASWYWNHADEALHSLPHIWNGDYKMWPRKTTFVVLVTPVCLFHRLRDARSWNDIGCYVVDEIHSKEALSCLFVAIFVSLKQQRDARVAHARLLLMTATPKGPVFGVIRKFFDSRGVTARSVKICPTFEPKECIHLWSLVDPPEHWFDQPF